MTFYSNNEGNYSHDANPLWWDLVVLRDARSDSDADTRLERRDAT